jgi:hypothetical protein
MPVRVVMVMVMMVMVMMVMVLGVLAVRAAFRLKGSPHWREMRPETGQHRFDHVVRPDAEHPVANFGRQVTIAEMPGEPCQLLRLSVSDLDERFRRRPHYHPAPVIEL